MGKKGKAKANKPKQATKPISTTSATIEDQTTSDLPITPPFRYINTSPSPDNQLAANIRKIIGSTLKIELSDGRVVIGELSSLDNQMNVILTNSYQAYVGVGLPPSSNAPIPETTKQMGHILISPQYIVKIHLAHYPQKQ